MGLREMQSWRFVAAPNLPLVIQALQCLHLFAKLRKAKPRKFFACSLLYLVEKYSIWGVAKWYGSGF